jgi:hypothetical protein
MTIDLGDLAPDVTVLDSGGRDILLSSLWAERPAVLVFLRHYG